MDKLEKALQKARQAREAHAAVARPAATAPEASALPPVPARPASAHDERHLETSRVIAHRTRHRDADVFRILRTQVLRAMSDANHRSLAITSPHYGDGKTTVSSNLALSIAQDVKQTVLLVDLDLRKPDLHRYLGVKAPHGLSDHLLDNVPLEDCLVQSAFERFSILPAGRALDHSSEVLGSPKMAALAEELARVPNRLVIYDMPPLLDQDDSMAFFPHVGAVLLVVRDGVTRTADVKRAVAALSGTHFIGTVLNRPAA
jgi:capsular exopolysaccharide synthesis family protein